MEHNVEEVTLNSGAKGLLINIPGSNVVNTKIYFRAGYQFGDMSKYEAPHLIEHHVLNATKKFPKKNQIMTEFSANGAYNNAFTNHAFISYLAECAEFEIERILELMTEAVARPLFPEEYYLTERENVRTELTRYLSDYARQVNVLASEASHPKLVKNYQSRLEQLDSITHEDVTNHYRKTHTAANSNFVITGAIENNREVIISKLNVLYDLLPYGERFEFIDEVGLGLKEPLVCVEEIDSIHFSLNWFQGEIDLKMRAAGNLLNTILTGGFGSRIFGKARDEGLTYYLHSSQDATERTSTLTMAGFCNREKWRRLLEVISSECFDIISHGPNIGELEAAKKRLIGGITVGSQTIGDISNWYSRDYVIEGTTLSYEEFFKLFNEISDDDIIKVAEHYLSSSNHNATLVGNVKKTDADIVDVQLSDIWKS